MIFFRSLALLIVLFVVYSSACHGSQAPRARASGQKIAKTNGTMAGEEPKKEKTDAQKKMEFETFFAVFVEIKPDDLKLLKTLPEFAKYFGRTPEQLKQHQELAKTDTIKYMKFIDFMKNIEE